MSRCLAVVLLVALTAPADASEALLAEARALLLDDQGAAAVGLYERVLASSEVEHHPEALEYLGVAEQLRGDPEAAAVRYRDYLERFPGSAGAPRVTQRLRALAVPPVVTGSALERDARLDVFGDFSQELWYDSFDNDQADAAVVRSYLLSFGSFGFDYRGARYDVGARVDAGYQRLLQDDGPNDDDQGQVANAYLQLTDPERGRLLRVGRQASAVRGVLGRFDGAAFAFALRPQLSLRADAGLLVDTTRHLADERRPFATVSLALEDLAEGLDLTVFGAVQRNDSLPDREALGAEFRFGSDALALSGVVDYDVSYETLNLAQLAANVRFSERLKLHGRVSASAAPFLTTTNALIGQSAGTLGELEDDYREAQLRTLARHRTSDVLTAAAGLRAVLSQRWYLNADATFTRFDGTVASAGVAEIPESQQSYLSIDLVGASVLKRRDSVLLGYRFDRSEAADTHSARLDLRLPLGRAVELTPALNVAWRELYRHGDTELLVAPGLRLAYRPHPRMRLELEGRGRWSRREAAPVLRGPLSLLEDEEISEYLLKASWRIDL